MGVVALELEGRPGFWVPSALFRVMSQHYDKAPALERRVDALVLEVEALRAAALEDARALALCSSRLTVTQDALQLARKNTSAPWEGPAWFGGGFAVGVAAVVLVAWALAETLQISLQIDR